MKIVLAVWNLINPFILSGLAFLVGMIVGLSLENRSKIIGKLGEWFLWIWIRLRLRHYNYKLLNNIWIPDGNGDVTQIDHIAISQWGIFVIENKTFDGELVQCYPNNRQWGFLSRTGGYYNWYSPLKQNIGHIRALSYLLGRPLNHFHSIVAFAGTTDFISQVPENVMHFHDVPQYLKEHSKITLIPSETISGIVLQIRELDASVSKKQRKEHDKNIRERYHKRDVKNQTVPGKVTSPTQNCQALTNPVQQNSSAEVTPASKPIIFSPKSLGGHPVQALDSQFYRVLPDSLKLPGEKDTTTNYLILSEWGIFVARHITRNGYIYHWGNGTKWKAQYADGKSYEFPNPLEQNNVLLQEWASRLQLSIEKFHSVIVFNDGATFKRDMPENVLLFSQVSEYLRQHSQEKFFRNLK
ncbi:MAG: NERD domain-containing protein [Victivallales bacterium]|nr:NERD domain-containing protein [Victivallales bacterium]